MSNETIQLLTPVINIAIVAIIGVIGGFITRLLIKLYPTIKSFLESKIGADNTKKLEDFAKKTFYQIEEDGRLGKLIDSKINTFATSLKIKYPAITDDEINFIRQAIAGEFNKDKAAVVQPVEQPIQEVVVTPVIKYTAPDGTELQPIEHSILNTPSIT